MTRNKSFFADKRILVVAAIIVVGLAGWLVLTQISSQTNDVSTDKQQSQQNLESVTIESDDDLDVVLNELDSLAIDDASEGTELDQVANEFSY